MNKILLSLFITSVLLSSDLLQDGIYPKCSYVEVTADGWKIHKNYEGRTLSMKPPGTHNVPTGKYSFDKFGNLIAFSECQTEEQIEEKIKTSSSEVDIDIEFDFSKLTLPSIDPKLSVTGGASMPFGDNLTHYGVGYHYGLDIHPNFSGFLKNISFSFMGMNSGHENTSKSSLTSNGFFINYELNWKKINLVGGAGMLNQEGVLSSNTDSNGSDTALKGGISFALTKKISIYTQSIQTMTFLGAEQTSTMFNFGLKYNF